jgi:hypothetical protein
VQRLIISVAYPLRVLVLRPLLANDYLVKTMPHFPVALVTLATIATNWLVRPFVQQLAKRWADHIFDELTSKR